LEPIRRNPTKSVAARGLLLKGEGEHLAAARQEPTPAQKEAAAFQLKYSGD
jgi:hypothetical protein